MCPRTQYSRSGLEPRLLDPETSALTIKPQRLHGYIWTRNKKKNKKFPSLRQLLKTATGSRNKSPSMPERPSSAGGMKSLDANGKVTKTRCKSAQPMNRAHRQTLAEEKKGLLLALFYVGIATI